MHRSFLIFAVAFVALMAGALFYAARAPVEMQARSGAAEQGATAAELTAAAAQPAKITFTLGDMDGVARDFNEWDGDYRLLNFWATWCAPCRREIPLLKAFQDTHGGDGVQVIGIAVDFIEAVVAYADNADFNYPVLVGEQEAMAVAESSGVDFIGLPFTMIVARDGELIGTHMGEIHQPQLDEMVSVFARLDRGEIDADAARAVLNSL